MRYLIKYMMLTGEAESQADSDDEVRSMVKTLKAAGARPITVEYEDDAGRRIPVAHLTFGPMSQPALRFLPRMTSNPHVPIDRRIDPSLHSISLADVRRKDCPLIFVNKGFERLTGYAREEVVGRNCRFLQGPGTERAAATRLSDAIRSGTPIILDILNYRKDGSEFWNRVSLKPVTDRDDNVTHVIGIQSDITRLVGLQLSLEEWAHQLTGASNLHR